MSVNKRLNLSPWQYQVLVDMQFDAWYLTPPKPSAAQQQEQQQSQRITDTLIETLMAENAQKKPQEQALDSPVQTPSQLMPKASTESDATATQASSPAQTTRSPVAPALSPIELNTAKDLTPPASGVYAFPASSLAHSDWQALKAHSEQVCDTVQPSAQPCVHGVFVADKETQADELFIFPAPAPARRHHPPPPTEHAGLSEREQTLQMNLLSSIGVSPDSLFNTRLTKHATAFGKDPDADILAKHLPLLATELALVCPKRLWLMGQVVAQAVLQTVAPLSALKQHHYQLTYRTAQGTPQTAEIVCLPTLDYLLALPAEKAKVWQQIKRLR